MPNTLQIQYGQVSGQVPTTLAAGELFVDLGATPPVLYVGQGGVVSRMGVVSIAAQAPLSPLDGTIWIDATNDRVFYYANGQWHPIGGGGGGDPFAALQQTVVSAAGKVDVDISKGRTALITTTGAITDFTITDPSNSPVGWMRAKLTTDGGQIDWTGIAGWFGQQPVNLPRGTHGFAFYKIDGDWYAEYLGTEIPKTKPFKMTIRAAAPAHDFTLPFASTGAYNVQVDWGDGSAPTAVTTGTGPTLTHQYAQAGDYQISIEGSADLFVMAATNALDVISVDAWGSVGWTTMNNAFQGCLNLVSVCAGDVSTTGDLEHVTSCTAMFQNCAGLRSVGLFDTSRVTSVRNMFDGCTALAVIPKFDFSKVTNMSAFANNCASLQNWLVIDLPEVTNLYSAWRGCTSLQTFPIINAPKCTNISRAWYGCSGLVGFSLLDLPLVSNASGAWQGCSSLPNFPLMNFPEALDVSSAWNGCSGLVSFPAIAFPKATNFSNAWNNCSGMLVFNAITVPKGVNFSHSWDGCSSLPAFPQISVPAGEDFSSAWYNCGGLKAFPAINFSKATTINSAWHGCAAMTSFSATNFPLVTDASSAWMQCRALETQSAPTLPVVEDLSMTWRQCDNLDMTFAALLSHTKFDAVTTCDSLFLLSKKMNGAFPMKVFDTVQKVGGMLSYTKVSSIPVLDTSGVTTFNSGGAGFVDHCPSLTAIPALDFSGVTAADGFKYFMNGCATPTFPPNLFDAVALTAADMTNFATSSSLDASSKENILVSIDTSGMTNGTLDIIGGAPLNPAATAAWTSLQGKGWTGTVS